MKRIADFRKANAKILKDVSPISEESSFLNENVVNVLKNRDQNRRRILIMNMGSKYLLQFPSCTIFIDLRNLKIVNLKMIRSVGNPNLKKQ